MYHLTTDSSENQSPRVQSITIHNTPYEARPEVWPRWSLLNRATSQGESFANMTALNLRLHELKQTPPAPPSAVDYETPKPGDTCDRCGDRPGSYSYPGSTAKYCWPCIVEINRTNDGQRPLLIAAWSVTTPRQARIDTYIRKIQATAMVPLRIASGPVLYVSPDGAVSDRLPALEIVDEALYNRYRGEFLGAVDRYFGAVRDLMNARTIGPISDAKWTQTCALSDLGAAARHLLNSQTMPAAYGITGD